MKTTSLSRIALSQLGLLMSVGFIAQAQLPFRPLADAPANAQEERELNLWLARNAQLRSGYLRAMDHYGQAWAAIRGLPSIRARQMGGEALGGLARSLALAGRLAELDALEQDVRQLGAYPAGSEWERAMEVCAWARKHPTLAYKCGLYSLDQLGRLTQPGQFQSRAIINIESSVNGFTAADLVQIAAAAGLRMHAAFLNNPADLPVPSIVHLASEHSIVLREQRGDFYGVYDRAGPGPRWLTAQEIAQEASGCVIVSDAVPSVGGQTTPLSAGEAAAYRGRMILGPYDHDDSDCPGNEGGGGDDDGRNAIADGNPNGDNPCNGCGGNTVYENGPVGMPTWHVSEPFLNLWVRDIPLHYNSAYGPDVSLRLAYNHRHQASVVSGQYWHGAEFGNLGGRSGLWACSWMSFAELKNDEYTVDLLLPQGG